MPKIRKKDVLFFCCALFYASVYSQSTENVGWLFLTHTQKISKKFTALADAQIRSGNELAHFETLLLRGGIGYKFNSNHSIATGYVYKGDWTSEDRKITYIPENRIYEQYLYNTNLRRTQLTFRVRLEQRFIKETYHYDFSQRVRALISAQIPLAANPGFTRGLYTTLQNEIFVNIQYKENINRSFFDQNRLFVSLGYRWSKKIDTEAGYMFWRQRESEGYKSSNVFQLMITTSF